MSNFVLHKPRLLCVDDDPGVLKMYQLILAGFGYTVAVAASGSAALRHVDSRRPDLVILDHDMPDMNCGELASRIKQLASDVPLIIVSAHSSVVEDASHFLSAALHKSSPIQVLIDQVETLLHLCHLERQSVRLVEHLA